MSQQVLEVRHLRLVRAIADEGGPTRAAARLHLTQSAVSHQLAELEGRLGIALFARVHRKLTPTPAGRRLIEESRALLAELTRVERELYRGGAPKREPLRIVVECFTSYHWLPPVVAALAREAPHVDVRIVLDATREPFAALARGAVDVALVTSPIHESPLVATALFDDEWAVIVAPDHRLAGRRWIGPAELAEETVFAPNASRADFERLRDLVATEKAAWPAVSIVPLTDALVDLVAAGVGVGLVSRWGVAPRVARGDVVARRFTQKGLAERWMASTTREARTRPHVERFIELTRGAGPARTSAVVSSARAARRAT